MGGIFKATTNAATSPKIRGLQIQSSVYGAVWPLLYGQSRTAGNLVWYGDFTSREQQPDTGGKGGASKAGGGSTRYSAAVAIGLAKGPIVGIVRLWVNKEKHVPSDFSFSVFLGSWTQSPWGWLTTHHPGEALNYPALAYVAASALDLGNSPSLPNANFEIAGRCQNVSGSLDANPKDIIEDLLSEAGFPSARLGSLSTYSTYCLAAGLLFSPAYTEQRDAAAILSELAEATNSAPVWSGTALTLVPYGDETLSGNGVTYTPPSAPLYDLTDDDFLDQGDEDPVTFTRKRPADQYNLIRLEYRNRGADYNIVPVEATNAAAIELYGLRPADPKPAHFICVGSVAQRVAQLQLQRLSVRNTYEFSTDWRYILVELMEIVTITDAGLGLDHQWARILEIEEDEDGELHFVVEEYLGGTGAEALCDFQEGLGYAADYNVSPGGITPPLFFEPPSALTSSGFEVWAAVSGGALWGGCDVYVSTDDATYTLAGRITGSARTGALTASLAASSVTPDITHTLSVDLSESRGEFLSATQRSADLLRTLSYCGGELLAYQTATLTGANEYDLTYLVRGAYGTGMGSHPAGSAFARLDGAIFKYPLDAALAGNTIYIKFVSFNIYGGGQQEIASVPAYSYAITGQPLEEPLANVQNLLSAYIAGQAWLVWDAVSDPFRPVGYEIRKGESWAGGTVVGRTPLTRSPILGDDSYWVSAHYRTPEGVDAYSTTPAGIAIAGASLTANVVASYDEAATGWTGTLGGDAEIVGSVIHVGGEGAAAEGSYTIPSGHIVNVGRVAPCSVIISTLAGAADPYQNILTTPNILAISDILHSGDGLAITVQPQIAVAGGDGQYGPWQNYVPGIYSARHFKARVLLASADPYVICSLEGLVFAVDVPDRIDKGTGVSVGTGGLTVTYSAAFNATPNVQITIISAQAGDDVVLSSQSASGFTAQVVNGGSGVARTINYFAQGY